MKKVFLLFAAMSLCMSAFSQIYIIKDGKCMLGWQELNLRMRESKSLALPLGYTPVWKNESGIGIAPNP